MFRGEYIGVGRDTGRRSAGLLLYRQHCHGRETNSQDVNQNDHTHDDATVEVLLAHPGGPLWARKDEGAWSLPKGLVEPGEDDLAAAHREFAEEIGTSAPAGQPIALGEVRLKSGKVVVGFAVEADPGTDLGGRGEEITVRSNTFEMVWPPRSGQMRSFPEVDRAQWFSPDAARLKLNPAQAEFVGRLLEALRG